MLQLFLSCLHSRWQRHLGGLGRLQDLQPQLRQPQLPAGHHPDALPGRQGRGCQDTRGPPHGVQRVLPPV